MKAASVPEIGGKFVPFSAKTRMSGVDFADQKKNIRKGAAEAVREWVLPGGRHLSAEVNTRVQEISAKGGTPLVGGA